jgi:hypothetical protein
MIQTMAVPARSSVRRAWDRGLRRGRARDTLAEYLRDHPELVAEFHRINAELRALGFAPASLDRVKQPFDFAARR